MAAKTLADAVSAYGASAKGKLANIAISGAAEDQLRGPLEALIRDLAVIDGMSANSVELVGETTLSELKTRPDFAVIVGKALVGFIEVKAPGKGADPRQFKDPHDKDQWDKLKSLPNLIYTDGNSFSLWRDGKSESAIVHLEGSIESAGAKLDAPATLLPLISDFLRWAPIPPKSAKQLAEVSARLCRLLRDEVIEQMTLGSPALTGLAHDWRALLFPQADDAQFADGYAQAVTFGLLVARARDISLSGGTEKAAQELKKSNSLIGTALRLLTEDTSNQEALKTSLGTLARVLDAVNWHTISKDKPEAWLYFYEDFLEVYDNALRKRTGSYYTPPEVVSAMVNLVDEALRGPLFERPAGFAAADVIVADPAVGTGTFLLGVLRRIAATVAEDQGAGAVRGAIEAAAKRIIGFEIQFGPFAVAQLRLIAELQALMNAPPLPELRLFITDTLGNPFIEEERLGQTYEPIAISRRAANKVKKEERITVVIGNPPYKEKAEGRGGWIEKGSGGKLVAPLDRWRAPPEWGVGAHAKHLKNLYIYFWRWATWKVFGSGNYAATGNPDKDRGRHRLFHHRRWISQRPRLRKNARRSAPHLLAKSGSIDCSPEGHQPNVPTRIFQGVQQPVCIVLAARKLAKSDKQAARAAISRAAKRLARGKIRRTCEAVAARSDWTDCPSGWRDPFLPSSGRRMGDLSCARRTYLFMTAPALCPAALGSLRRIVKFVGDALDAADCERRPDKKELLFHPHLRKGKPGDKLLKDNFRRSNRS